MNRGAEVTLSYGWNVVPRSGIAELWTKRPFLTNWS